MVILISVKCSEPGCSVESVLPIRRPGLGHQMAGDYDGWPHLGVVLVHFHKQGWRVGAGGAVCPKCVQLQAAERFREVT